jgi:hypothetical protein
MICIISSEICTTGAVIVVKHPIKCNISIKPDKLFFLSSCYTFFMHLYRLLNAIQACEIRFASLLEDLAISAVFKVPGHVVLDFLLLLFVLRRLNLSELVRFVISSIVDFVRDLLTTDHPVTRDAVVVVGATNDHGTESILVSTLKTGIETTDQVVRHESLGELIVVLVIGSPDGETFGIMVFPEPLHGDISVVVGVHTLPSIHDEGRGRQKIESALGLGSRLGLFGFFSSLGLLLLLGLLGLLFLLRLSSLLLLLRRSVLESNFAERNVTNNSLEVRLVDQSLEVTVDVLVLSTELLIEKHLVRHDQGSGNSDISIGNLLTDQVGLVKEDLVKDIHGTLNLLDGSINRGLKVIGISHKRTKPRRKVAAELVVREKNPLLDKSTLSSSGTEEGGVLLVSSNVVGDGIGLAEEETVSTLKSGNLTHRELFKELRCLGSGHIETLRDFDFESVITGSDQSLVDSGVVGVGVDFL